MCDELGPEAARDLIGVDATGLAFDSVEAIERGGDGRTNPMVNAGAIATTSAVPGANADEKWACILDGLSRFAGHTLAIHDDVYASASATNLRNREITQSLDSEDRLAHRARDGARPLHPAVLPPRDRSRSRGDGRHARGWRRAPDHSRACRVDGVVPRHARGDDHRRSVRDVGNLALRRRASGKSGIGGGIVTVSPGKGAIGTFSPPLDAAGNSVRGVRAAAQLSRTLGLDLFMSSPSDASARQEA